MQFQVCRPRRLLGDPSQEPRRAEYAATATVAPPETKRQRARLKDHALVVRVHQRYRVIKTLHAVHAPIVAAERIGCHVSTVVLGNFKSCLTINASRR